MGGDTIYNMIRLGEGHIEDGDRPKYPHKIIKTKVNIDPTQPRESSSWILNRGPAFIQYGRTLPSSISALRIRDVYPGSDLSIFNLKTDRKVWKIRSGMFIPDPGSWLWIFPSRIQRSKKHRIRILACLHWSRLCWGIMPGFENLHCSFLLFVICFSVHLAYYMRIEWLIEDQAFSPSYDLAHPPPPPTPSSASCLSFSFFLCVACWAYWLERGGGEEPGRKKSRKPGPLKIIQYSLGTTKD